MPTSSWSVDAVEAGSRSCSWEAPATSSCSIPNSPCWWCPRRPDACTRTVRSAGHGSHQHVPPTFWVSNELLPDDHLGGFDDHRDPIARLELQPLHRSIGDGRHHLSGLDLDLDLGHDAP